MKLKELRLKAKYTQKNIAEKLNIPLNTYTQYELGNREPTVSTLIKIANLYNVSLDYLLENPNTPKQQSEFTLQEEEIIDIFRELSDENKEMILRNFYILLNPNRRENYEILKYIK